MRNLPTTNTHLCKLLLLLPILLLQISCDLIGDINKSPQNTVTDSGTYTTVEWTDLMPEADLQALLNPPEYLFNVDEGSVEDERLFEQLTSGKPSDDLDPYAKALLSRDIREEFDEQNIRIAGFLVPLEFESPEVVSQAFLVPYFGACIHVPPPPPNQIILLNASDGISLDDMYNPYWVSGKINTTLYENELGTSAYAMEVTEHELYTEQ